MADKEIGGLPDGGAPQAGDQPHVVRDGNSRRVQLDSMAGEATSNYHTAAEANAITDLLAPKTSPAFSGVPTVPTAAIGTDTTQIASTSFVLAALAQIGSIVTLQTEWDASAGTFPGSGSAQRGQSWIVSTSGTVDGVDFSAGDRVIAIVDNASTTVFASNWMKLDYTPQVLSVVGLTGAVSKVALLAALNVEDGATAGGMIPLELSPLSVELAGLASPAALDTRNGHPVLAFDATDEEEGQWTRRLPTTYGGNGLTVDIYFAAATATTGDVDWDVSIERIGDGVQDIDNDGYAAVNSSDNNTVPGTSGDVTSATVTFTDGADMDNWAAGELGRIKVRGENTGSAVGDMQVLLVVVRETP